MASPELWVKCISRVVVMSVHLTAAFGVLICRRVSRPVVPDSLWPPWTVARQPPLSLEFPDENTRVGCHSLLQGIFPTQDQTQVSGIAGGFFTD